MTPVEFTVHPNQQEAVKLLIAHGCNVKASAMDDMNALHFAAQKGQLGPITHLLAAGAGN